MNRVTVSYIILLLGFFANALHAVTFPWGEMPVRKIRCLVAKEGMVLLSLEFDEAIEDPVFRERNYAVLKWINYNPMEVELNAKLLSVPGTLPAIGYHTQGFTLQELLPNFDKSTIADIAASIQKRAGGRRAILDRDYRLNTENENGVTLIVMPFMPLMNLEDFVANFGADEELIESVESNLRPTFDKMMLSGIVHGDLALRNVGIVFTTPGPFDNLADAKGAINGILLFDFGGRRARILKPSEPVPYIESLEYVKGLLKSKLSKNKRQPVRRPVEIIEDAVASLPPSSPLITPLRVLRFRDLAYGSPYKQIKLDLQPQENEENL